MSVKKISQDKIATGSKDKRVLIFNMSSNKSLKSLKHTDAIKSLEILSPGKLITGTKNIIIWDLENTNMITMMDGHDLCINKIQVVPNDIGNFFSCSDDKKIKLWDGRISKCVLTLSDHTSEVNSIKCFSNYLLTSCSNDHLIKFYDIRQTKCLKSLKNTSSIYDLELRENGDLISCNQDKTIKMWHKNTKLLSYKTIYGHQNKVNRIKMFDNDILISCSDDKTIKVLKSSYNKMYLIFF